MAAIDDLIAQTEIRPGLRRTSARIGARLHHTDLHYPDDDSQAEMSLLNAAVGRWQAMRQRWAAMP